MACFFQHVLRARAGTAILALCLAAGAAPPHHPAGLEGSQTVSAAGGEILVTVTFRNTSSSPVLLEKLEPGQDPLRAEFELRTGSREIPYTGPMAKRRPYAREDFFPLEPGHEHVRRIRVDGRYDFPPGRRRYSIAHVYLVWDEQAGQAVARTLKPARFSFGG